MKYGTGNRLLPDRDPEAAGTYRGEEAVIKMRFRVVFESGLMSGPYSWAWIVSRLDSDIFEPVLIDRTPTSLFDALLREQKYSSLLDRSRSSLGQGQVATPVILVGHSIGGLLVQAHARYLGGLTAGLVLVDPAPPAQFTPGADTSYKHLRLNQALFLRTLRALVGQGVSEIELGGVRQLPPIAAEEAEARMNRPRFWADAYRESRAAAAHWVEASYPTLRSGVATAVVSSEVANIQQSLQARHIDDLLESADTVRHLRDASASHESIVFNEEHSRIVNEAILWVADAYANSHSLAKVIK